MSALVNESPSRAMINALSKQPMALPALPSVQEKEEDEESAAEDGDGHFLYKNARGEWINLLEMSVGTLSGMLLDWAKEKREKEAEVEQSSYQQILHDAAAVDGHSTMAMNAAIVVSKVLDEVKTKGSEDDMAQTADLFKKLLHHFYELPQKVVKNAEMVDLIEEALRFKEQKKIEKMLVNSAAKRKEMMDSAGDAMVAKKKRNA